MECTLRQHLNSAQNHVFTVFQVGNFNKEDEKRGGNQFKKFLNLTKSFKNFHLFHPFFIFPVQDSNLKHGKKHRFWVIPYYKSDSSSSETRSAASKEGAARHVHLVASRAQEKLLARELVQPL